MPARTPKAAVDAFEDELRLIAGCITEQPLLVTGYRPSPRPHYASFVPVGKSVALRSQDGSRHVEVAVRSEFHVDPVSKPAPGFAIRLTSYAYRILDRDGREILAYHWHPFSVSPITYPHVHLTNRIRAFDLPTGGSIALAAMHLPTGFVTLAAIFRLLITEFGIQPRRADWANILKTDL